MCNTRICMYLTNVTQTKKEILTISLRGCQRDKKRFPVEKPLLKVSDTHGDKCQVLTTCAQQTYTPPFNVRDVMLHNSVSRRSLSEGSVRRGAGGRVALSRLAGETYETMNKHEGNLQRNTHKQRLEH